MVVCAEEGDRAVLGGGEAAVSCGEAEGLCLRGVSAHARQVHQHVRSARRTQEYEVQRQERLLHLQKVLRSICVINIVRKHYQCFECERSV